MANQFIPQGDYTYLNDQLIDVILQYNSVSQNPITYDCSDTELQNFFRYFNTPKKLVCSFFRSSRYIYNNITTESTRVHNIMDQSEFLRNY